MIDTTQHNHAGRQSAIRMEMGKGAKRTLTTVSGAPGSGGRGQIVAAMAEILATNKGATLFVAAGSVGEGTFSHTLTGSTRDWSRTFTRAEVKAIVAGTLDVPQLEL